MKLDILYEGKTPVCDRHPKCPQQLYIDKQGQAVPNVWTCPECDKEILKLTELTRMRDYYKNLESHVAEDGHWKVPGGMPYDMTHTKKKRRDLSFLKSPTDRDRFLGWSRGKK